MNNTVVVRTKVIINGTEYPSLEDVPPRQRALYERAVEAAQQGEAEHQVIESSGVLRGGLLGGLRKIVINGKAYDSVDQIPDDWRDLYLSAMQGLDRDANGIPDMLDEHLVAVRRPPSPAAGPDNVVPGSPKAEPGAGRWLLVGAAAAALLWWWLG